MKYSGRLMVCAALATVSTACNGFLTGPGIDKDPNGTTELLKPGPLYTAIQAEQSVQFEGQLARSALMYTQQVSGNARQQVGYDRGFIAPPDIDTYFSAVYGTSRTITGGGGLLDIRKMEQLGRRLGDSIYVGIGKVYEALVIGAAADLWGAIPYREAADSNNETPRFDPQLQIYQDLLAQLDSAITVFLAVQLGGTMPDPPPTMPRSFSGDGMPRDFRRSTSKWRIH